MQIQAHRNYAEKWRKVVLEAHRKDIESSGESEKESGIEKKI